MSAKILRYVFWEATASTPKPDVSFVPALIRRRLTFLERAVIHVVHELGAPEGLPVVFASRWGEINTTCKLIRQLTEEGEMSPTGFSDSVHNAAPGMLSVLTHNHAPYTAIAAGEDTFRAGLTEACALGGDVVYVYAEEPTPAFYRAHFPSVTEGFAAAFLISECAAS